MKKSHTLCAMRYMLSFFVLAASLSGCGSQYSAERLYWQANQAAKDIAKGQPLDKLNDQDYEKIIFGYRRLTERFPLESISAQSQFIVTQVYVLRKQYREAEEEMVKVIQNFSNNTELASQAQFMIGSIYERQGKQKKAVQEYDKISDLYPLSRIGLKMPVYIAEYYQRDKNELEAAKAYEKAIKYYKGLVKEYSGTSFAAVLKDYLALAYVSQGSWDKAVDIWQRIVDENPQDQVGEGLLFTLGETYLRQIKDLQKAIDTYEDFVSKNPNSKIIKHAKFQIGRLYLIKGDFSGAIKIFNEIIKNYPKETKLCTDAKLAIAACYEKQGDWEGVMRVYAEIKAAYPDTSAALSIPLFIAQHYQKENRPAEAESAFKEAILGYEKIIKRDPHGSLAPQAWDLISLGYLSQQKWDKAVDSLQVLTEAYPEDIRAPKAMFTMAIIYRRQLRDTRKAKETFERFIQQYPGHELAGLAKSEIESLQGSPASS
ncbi:MAG: tetratricopeptide repeat protein [Candidatus Omnitrophota bacterium]